MKIVIVTLLLKEKKYIENNIGGNKKMKTYTFRITYQDDYIEVEAENEQEAWELADNELADLFAEPNIELENPDEDD